MQRSSTNLSAQQLQSYWFLQTIHWPHSPLTAWLRGLGNEDVSNLLFRLVCLLGAPPARLPTCSWGTRQRGFLSLCFGEKGRSISLMEISLCDWLYDMYIFAYKHTRPQGSECARAHTHTHNIHIHAHIYLYIYLYLHIQIKTFWSINFWTMTTTHHINLINFMQSNKITLKMLLNLASFLASV